MAVIENDTMTMREIVTRQINGTLFDNYNTPFYEEQAVFSTLPLNIIQNMDLSEKLQYLTEIKGKATALQAQIQAYKDAEEQANAVKQSEPAANPEN